MRSKQIVRALFCLIYLGFSGMTMGQDIHFSQFHNSMLNINPGQTGVFNGDQRFTALIRDQWRSVPVPYLTVAGAFDMRLTSYKFRERFFGLGGHFNYDQAGDSKMSLVNFSVNGSYAQVLNPRNIISAGIGVGLSQRRFNEDDLRWAKQWNGDSYDPGLPSGEAFDATNILFLDLSAGFQYRYQVSSRTWINVGGAGFHLNGPDQSYYSLDRDNTDLPIRWSGSITSSFQIGPDFDLMVNGLYQFQNPYEEIVFNGIARIYLNNKPGRHYILDLGFGMRLDDAYYPVVGFQYNNWYVSASYDVNTSFFEIATDRRGGPEIGIRYIYANPTPPNEFKKCPVY